jgi:tetratricopeptide (TPR) repeat protein
VIPLPAMSPARRTLLFAESHYRRALEFDPALEEARLRLGRVLSLRNDLKGARLELEPLARSAALPRIRYLAHLFLGAVAEYQNDLAAARVAYLDALSIGPDCQTPYIALTFVEQAMGHGDSARALMARYAALSKDTTRDPWWAYQNGGIDAESLVWLRQQAMR